MARNNIIDFLCNQSIGKERMLYDLLKDENFNIPKKTSDKRETSCETDVVAEYKMVDEVKPQFTEKKRCIECRFYNGMCTSKIAQKKGCGVPDYKYFEER